MYGTSFTEPVGKSVLKLLFENNPVDMYEFAVGYLPGVGGPKVLGIEFRKLVGNKNRTSWWRGAKVWLLGNYQEELSGKLLDERSKLDCSHITNSNFTNPTGEKVLNLVFDNNFENLYNYATGYVDGVGGPYNLGINFRNIIKNRNRTDWWRGAKKWLESK